MFDLTTQLPATMHTAAQACVSNVRSGSGLGYWSETEFSSLDVVLSNNEQDPIKMQASFYKDSSV